MGMDLKVAFYVRADTLFAASFSQLYTFIVCLGVLCLCVQRILNTNSSGDSNPWVFGQATVTGRITQSTRLVGQLSGQPGHTRLNVHP